MSDVRQQGFLPPTIDLDSEPWWTALSEERLLLPRCRVCSRYWFPVTPGCPHCGANDYELVAASGRGSVYSWVVIHRALSPAFAADVPYTIGLVELDEGPRLFGRLFGSLGSTPEAGAAVSAVFYTVEGRTLLGFERGARDGQP